MSQIIEVAIPVPLYNTFDYICNQEVSVGARVKVPFGPKKVIGIVLSLKDRSEFGKLRAIEEVIDTDSEIDIGNIDDIDDTNEIEIKTENITSNISVETSDDSIDSEIDDITQQCIAEREQNRTIIDLQSDNED